MKSLVFLLVLLSYGIAYGGDYYVLDFVNENGEIETVYIEKQKVQKTKKGKDRPYYWYVDNPRGNNNSRTRQKMDSFWYNPNR